MLPFGTLLVYAACMARSEHDHRQIEAVAEVLGVARRALFVTGAGISADSGLPTYRGIGGLYNDRHTEEGIPIEQALSGPFFEEHPEITWRYLLQIEEACRDAKPNRGHEVIARLEQRIERVCVLTQNVDGLHRAAGSTCVIDIHGDMHEILCTRCDCRQTVKDYAGLEPLPLCPECGAVLRPDVVLFEELLPVHKVEKLLEEQRRGFDIVFSIGTSSLFPYISEPVYQARALGIPTVEINPGATDVSSLVDHHIRAGAAEAMDAIWRALP